MTPIKEQNSMYVLYLARGASESNRSEIRKHRTRTSDRHCNVTGSHFQLQAVKPCLSFTHNTFQLHSWQTLTLTQQPSTST